MRGARPDDSCSYARLLCLRPSIYLDFTLGAAAVSIRPVIKSIPRPWHRVDRSQYGLWGPAPTGAKAARRKGVQPRKEETPRENARSREPTSKRSQAALPWLCAACSSPLPDPATRGPACNRRKEKGSWRATAAAAASRRAWTDGTGTREAAAAAAAVALGFSGRLLNLPPLLVPRRALEA